MPLDPSLLGRTTDLSRLGLLLGVGVFGLLAWAAYVALRRKWSTSRQQLVRAQLVKMRSAVIVAALSWAASRLLFAVPAPWLHVGAGFVAAVTILHAGLRVGHVFLYEWLFAHNTREGVPVLLVDLFTIVASLILFGAVLHTLFLIEVASLFATSAVVSVVLGLALQDTLGQLFAGISLQLDRPFRLGDWVEVRVGGDRISGQVLEVSWRATMLLAITEELVTIPNKAMAQGVVSNFSGRERPFVRSYVFRLRLDADLALAKSELLEAARETKGVLEEPAAVPLVIETTESWVTLKMIVFVDDYGGQFGIGDAFQSRALARLAAAGVALAGPRLALDGVHVAPAERAA